MTPGRPVAEHPMSRVAVVPWRERGAAAAYLRSLPGSGELTRCERVVRPVPGTAGQLSEVTAYVAVAMPPAVVYAVNS